MKVLTEGHRYELSNFEKKESVGQTLQFIEKTPVPKESAEFEGQLSTLNDGTTNEELIEVLINRLQYLNGKFPCRENSVAKTLSKDEVFKSMCIYMSANPDEVAVYIDINAPL